MFARLSSVAVLALLIGHTTAARAADCPRGAVCGRIAVPLDHAGAVPGTLSIAYARVPATEARRGTLVILAGGPGQASIPLEPSVAHILGDVREHYDFVFIDQRATGDSGAVSCPDTSTAKQVQGCAARLG